MREWLTTKLHDWISVWFVWVHDWGYWGVGVLMALESTIVPVPSEVVIPPAAYWAQQGRMSLVGVIIAGTIGSYLGSTISYWVARVWGRPILMRWGSKVGLGEAKLQRAERFVARYGMGGIFFARLLPVVRHVISLPAGMALMPFKAFSVMTLAGSAVWCSILAWYGAKVAERNPDLMKDPGALIAAIKKESLSFVIAVVVLGGLYALVLWLTSDRKKESSSQL